MKGYSGDSTKVRRRLQRAARAARRAEPAALAAEGQQLVVPDCVAAKPQEPVRQNAAPEEGVELIVEDLGSSEPVLVSVCAMKRPA
jgi:hypothetical protein